MTDQKRSRETPRKTVRVPDAVWEEAKRKAAAEGKTVSDVVNECLRRYLARKK